MHAPTTPLRLKITTQLVNKSLSSFFAVFAIKFGFFAGIVLAYGYMLRQA